MNPKFPLGNALITPNALLHLTQDDFGRGLARHQSGDWGDVCEDDRKQNELSLEKGLRLHSVYRASNGIKFWIITEADRSATTVLMPEDY